MVPFSEFRELAEYSSHPISVRPISILHSRLFQGLESDLLPGFPNTLSHAFRVSPRVLRFQLSSSLLIWKS